MRRLHPLAVIGATAGLLAYAFDPFATHDQVRTVSDAPLLLLLNFVLALAMLPAPALPSSWNMTHSLNGPAWSLFQEYVANLIYGRFGHRIPLRGLAGFAAASALALLCVALSEGSLSGGWSWDTFGTGALRVSASFSIGLLIHRCRLSVPLPYAFPVLAVVLLLVFTAPEMGRFSGSFDWLMAMVVFPFVVMAGAAPPARSNAYIDAVAGVSGRGSYPLYVLHYPFLTLFAHWMWREHPGPQLVWAVAGAIMVAIPVLSWWVLTYVDEPLRRSISRPVP